LVFVDGLLSRLKLKLLPFLSDILSDGISLLGFLFLGVELGQNF
jgi:hypothetical protein